MEVLSPRLVHPGMREHRHASDASAAPKLSQPLIAVPVFMFARHFIFWRSVGLGFAAGSMIYVTCFELLADAIKVTTLMHNLCFALLPLQPIAPYDSAAHVIPYSRTPAA
jgi:zinc transporter ZupT